jgi:hypothetical protein
MKRLSLIFLLGLGLLFLNACAAKSTVMPLPEETKATVPTASVNPTQPIALEPVVNECVTCHTDKEMLIQTAEKEEEASESESEGVG